MSQWTHPQCEACWTEENSEWEELPDSKAQVLKSVRIPVRVKEPELEQCCTCGCPTFVGIFVRKDPSEVPFPASEEPETA